VDYTPKNIKNRAASRYYYQRTLVKSKNKEKKDKIKYGDKKYQIFDGMFFNISHLNNSSWLQNKPNTYYYY
jgi:hypothetical protein